MIGIAPACYVNGVDLAASCGFVLDGLSGLGDHPDRSDVLVDLPQGFGAVLADVPGRVQPRSVTLEGTLPAATRAAREAALDRLKATCATGTVELRVVGRNVVLYGRLVGITVTQLGPALKEGPGAARASLRFTCADPIAWDTEAQVIGFGSTPIPLPLGTAPSRGRLWYGAVITIHGPATTPTLTEYDAAGVARRSMAFTWSPTANDYLEIDVGRGLVTRGQSGARDNALGLLSPGWEFPRLDPAEGDYLTGAFPSLAVSTGTGVVRYVRGWR